MNQSHYLQFKQFIKIAFHDVNAHLECRDHASQRVMMFSYGRVVGAYAMCGIGFLNSGDHGDIQELDEAYHDAMSMNIY